MTWTAERIAELKRLWAAGTPTAEIGRRLGVSKNAVVGKAHRLGLAARPSPIKRSDVTLVGVVVDGNRPCQWPFGDPLGCPGHARRSLQCARYCIQSRRVFNIR